MCVCKVRAACCDGLTSAWLAPSTQCVCLLWPLLWLLRRVWRSLPLTVAFMLGRPGGIICSSKPYASVCDKIGCSAFDCACTFTIASRLYGCGFCACDSSMDPRLWRARVLLRLSCSLVLAAALRCVRLLLQESTASMLHDYAWRSLFPPFH